MKQNIQIILREFLDPFSFWNGRTTFASLICPQRLFASTDNAVTILEEVNGRVPAAATSLRQKFSAISLPGQCSTAFTGQYPGMNRTVPNFTNRRIAAGQTVSDSLKSAASVRLRPILMTAMTTIFALIPVAVNPAVGQRIFQPFAITVIGGLLSATAATLILVPVLRTFSPGPRQ